MECDFDLIIDRRASDSAKWNKYGEEVIPLWVADMDFRSPEPVMRAICERAEHGVFGYALEPVELRSVLVERLERLYGWTVSEEALVFLPCVMTGFNLATRTVTSPGDGVLVQTPIYFPILRTPGFFDCTLDGAELALQKDGSYAIDFEAFEAAITERTRIFILCNPHNPVGRVFRRDELLRMAEICLRHDIVICSDEIHCDLLLGGSRHLPIASLAPEIADRTITLMAPTKTFNIAGIRCSVAIVENNDLRERFTAARSGIVPATMGALDYAATLAAFRDGQPWLTALLCYLEDNCDFVLDYVNSKLPGISMARPEGTYLAWLNGRDAGLPGIPHEFFLEQARVAMNDGATFGAGGEGFVRLNFGCPRSTLAEALHRMREALLGL